MTPTGVVTQACNPYPFPSSMQAFEKYRDNRHSRWLTQVLEGLSEDEMRQMVRSFAILHPRDFESDLCMTERCRRPA